MELTYTQFRSAIESKIAELQALPSTPQIVVDIVTLQTLLAGIPTDG